MSTNFYGMDHFKTIVSVNLTSMLVTATLHATVHANLPATSSLKMIDVWMLFAMAIPFMEIIIHTAMAWIKQKYESVLFIQKDALENVDEKSACKKVWKKIGHWFHHGKVLRYLLVTYF